VHNLGVKVPLLNDPGLDLPESVDLDNWTKRYDPAYREGVDLEQTTRHLILRGRGRGPTKDAAEKQALARLRLALHELKFTDGC
jgi:hypothetical protein